MLYSYGETSGRMVYNGMVKMSFNILYQEISQNGERGFTWISTAD